MIPAVIALLVLLQAALPNPTGSISGVLRKSDGSPAAGVRVAATSAAKPVSGVESSEPLVGLAQTDPLGRFRLDGVPSGSYYVVAGRVDAPTFYPGVPLTGGARAVTVSPETVFSGVDFVVSDASLRPVSGYSDLLPPPVSFNGRVVLADDSLQLPASVFFRIRGEIAPASGAAPGFVYYLAVGTVDAGGRFQVTLRAARSQVTLTQLPSGFNIRSMTAGRTDLLKERLDIVQGQPAPEIVIMLSADPYGGSTK